MHKDSATLGRSSKDQMALNPEPLLHALVIPYPTQGHMTPMMYFAKTLASKGLTVTFVTTHHRHHQIIKSQSRSDLQVDPIQQDAHNLNLDIRSAQISDGLPLDFDRSAGFSEFMLSVENMGGELEQLIQNLNKTGPPISCVIADTMLFWSLQVTKKFGIPWISFWTQPTVVYSIYYHAHLVEAKRQSHSQGSVGDEDNVLIDYIPGIPPIHSTDLPSFFNETDADSQYLLDLFHKSFQSSRRADWVLCNSFDELENAVNASMNLQPPVLCVGPLLPSGYLNAESRDADKGIGTSLLTEYDSLEWLDTKPEGSVIYVSFGSLIHLSKAQLEEISMGLKDSGQPFLWVLRPDIVASTVSDSLPDGFLEEMGSKAIVVPWCNQLQVLSHPSVAGFITHCGWNSMLEGIALGVPMLGFPCWADQFTNCKFMVDEWKLGFRLRGGSHAGEKKMVERKDISSAIRKLFTDEGKEMKKNVEALKQSASTAVRGGGSSDRNLDSFVSGLKALNAELKGKQESGYHC